MVFEELRTRKRVVAELRAKVAAGRRLASLRRLTSKVTRKRQPNSLRDAEGQQVEDQSRWSDIVHEHFKENQIRRRGQSRDHTEDLVPHGTYGC